MFSSSPLDIAQHIFIHTRGSCLCGRRRLRVSRKVCVAGAILRASGKGCGAPCRRWPAAPLCVAGAVSEPLERVAARLVPTGPQLCVGRRSADSLQKGLQRAWSPLARGTQSVAKELQRAWSPRAQLLFDRQYSEPLKGLRRVWSPLSAASLCEAQFSEPLKGCGAPGLQLLSVWQTQCSEKGWRRTSSPLARGFSPCQAQ